MIQVDRVKLLNFVNGEFVVVDYGLAALADVYASQGYIVEFLPR